MESLTAAEVVGRTLAALGVRDAFGVLGSGNFVATQALHAAGAAFHHARHEDGAICMADGYARVSGRVGVCSVHQGPGFTNAMTGLTEAAKSRTPLLLLAGEAPAAALRSNFRLDQAALATTVGAVAERVHSGASAADDVARALRRAQVERRPVLLNMPLDVQREPAPRGPPPAPPRPRRTRPPRRPGRRRGRRADRRRRRPVIIAGRGAVLAGAREALEALGDAIGAVLATSAMGHGLFAGSPWAVGISGGFASPVAARLIAAVRPRARVRRLAHPLDDARRRADRPGAKVVQVDLDPDAATGRSTPPWSATPPRRRGRCSTPACGAPASATTRWPRRSPPARGATSRTRTPARTAAWTRGRSRSPSTRCCPASAPSPSTRGTSWASRRCTCASPTPPASCSRRRSSRSASAWPAASAPRSRAPTASPSPASATAAR